MHKKPFPTQNAIFCIWIHQPRTNTLIYFKTFPPSFCTSANSIHSCIDSLPKLSSISALVHLFSKHFCLNFVSIQDLSTLYICKWRLPECLNHWPHLLGFSPLCTLIWWVISLAAWGAAKLHWSHLLEFSPLIFILSLRFAVWDVEKLHLSRLLDFLHFVSSNDF